MVGGEAGVARARPQQPGTQGGGPWGGVRAHTGLEVGNIRLNQYIRDVLTQGMGLGYRVMVVQGCSVVVPEGGGRLLMMKRKRKHPRAKPLT